MALILCSCTAHADPKPSVAVGWSAPHIPYDAAPHTEADGRVTA